MMIKLKIKFQMVEKMHSWGMRPDKAWGSSVSVTVPASRCHRADDSGYFGMSAGTPRHSYI